uniref:Uncharacterized protein n=1 Tax=Rhizophora mucronata TaxID=61149 RepID=A0A2P2QB66_RHIMU
MPLHWAILRHCCMLHLCLTNAGNYSVPGTDAAM